MIPTRVWRNGKALARTLRRLHERRRKTRKDNAKSRGPRGSLTPAQRAEVLKKTGGRCHICGAKIPRRSRWAADHILPYANGGKHEVSNYLPAHGACNKYRRAYEAEEFEWILKLGVWFRTQIAKENPLALELADRFVRHEERRLDRRLSE
jgi:5-methylcytosine-specific restriction endonuclease McrA